MEAETRGGRKISRKVLLAGILTAILIDGGMTKNEVEAFRKPLSGQ